MAFFQGLFFLVLGVGLVVVVYRSLSAGWLPFGPNGLRGRVELRRSEQPFGYWVAFLVFALGGIWATFTGVGMLLGLVQPLPL